MDVKVIPVTGFMANCIIIWPGKAEQCRDCIVIDPGGDVPQIESALNSVGGRVQAILLTHGHIDHVGGADQLRRLTEAKVYAHVQEKTVLERVGQQSLMFGLPVIEPLTPDQTFEDNDELRFGLISVKVLHTPGHSPGHSVFVVSAGSETVLISGDLLFAGSVGRTDLWGGDANAMKESLDRIVKLPEDLVVYPGHGAKTTVGREKATNYFLRHSWL